MTADTPETPEAILGAKVGDVEAAVGKGAEPPEGPLFSPLSSSEQDARNNPPPARSSVIKLKSRFIVKILRFVKCVV